MLEFILHDKIPTSINNNLIKRHPELTELEKCMMYTVKSDKTEAGYAIVYKNYFERVDALLMVWIQPDLRGKGIGSSLVEYIVQDVKTNRKNRIIATRESNVYESEQIEDFLFACGFEEGDGEFHNIAYRSQALPYIPLADKKNKLQPVLSLVYEEEDEFRLKFINNDEVMAIIRGNLHDGMVIISEWEFCKCPDNIHVVILDAILCKLCINILKNGEEVDYLIFKNVDRYFYDMIIPRLGIPYSDRLIKDYII